MRNVGWRKPIRPLSPNGINIKIYADSEDEKNVDYPFNIESGLIICRVEFNQSAESGNVFISVDGSGWLDTGWYNCGLPPTGTTYSEYIMVNGHSYGSIVDEAIFWKNTNKFTDDELSALRIIS